MATIFAQWLISASIAILHPFFVSVIEIEHNPKDATAGTLRADYAASIDENAVHGSDAAASAAREIAFFFSDAELCGRTR